MMIIRSHSRVSLVGASPTCILGREINANERCSVRICINGNGSSSSSGGGGGALPLLSAGTKKLSPPGVGTSSDGGTICRAASFARGVLLMRWAKTREANWMEVIVAVSRGGLLGVIKQWRRGVTGECPTSTLQTPPERVSGGIYLPVGACFAQSSPSFHRYSRNPTTIQSIIDDMESEKPRSHKISAKPMLSVQVNPFS